MYGAVLGDKRPSFFTCRGGDDQDFRTPTATSTLGDALAILAMDIDLWEVTEAANQAFSAAPRIQTGAWAGSAFPWTPISPGEGARPASYIDDRGFHDDKRPHARIHRGGVRRGPLDRHRKALNGSRWVSACARERDMTIRESPPLRVIEELEKTGASVTFYDLSLLNPSARKSHKGEAASPPRTAGNTRPCGCDRRTHQCRTILYDGRAPAVFDTKNVMKPCGKPTSKCFRAS